MVEPWLPRQLVSADARSRLAALSPALPAPLADGFYLECHLGDGPCRTDLILEISDAGRTILAGENPAISIDPSLSAHPVWAALGELCRHRLRRLDGLHQQVRRIWLEFDLESSGRRRPVAIPRVFIDWIQPLVGTDARQAVMSLVQEYGALAGHSLADDLRAALHDCLENLPEAISVYSIGFFPDRQGQAVRLCLRGTEGRHLEYLREVHRTKDFPCRPAATVAGSDAGSRRQRILHLDVSASGGSNVGLEHGLRHLGRSDLLVSPYLDCLVAAGLCTPAKRKGLAAWPGGRIETFSHELWPSIAARWVNHVKVTIAAGGTRRAKAYLCHRHVPHAGRARQGSSL